VEAVRVLPTRIQGVRIRWRIFSMLVAAGAVVYFQQRAISIAAERIMPELHLSQMQIGWLQWAFVLSYGLLQMPGGVVGQRIGARRALAGLLLIAVVASLAAPLAPYVLQGTALFAALFLSQLLLGMAHAPFFPVCAGIMESWLPASRWALAQGLHTFGCQVGAAIAPLAFVLLIASLGWQPALIWAALPPLVLIAIWVWYGRNSPGEHPSVSTEEIGELDPALEAPTDTRITRARVWAIMRNRNVAVTTLSYTCMNYAYYLLSNWTFLYLIQERHFALIEGGALASLPPIGAAIGAGAGGGITDELCRRFGVRWGFRLVPLVSLTLAGVLLLLATGTPNAYVAVGALTLAYTAIEINEAAYWAGTMRIARADTMAATGVLNTGGNAGGLIGIPIVAYLSGQGHWQATFLIGFACALAAALAWLWVDASAPLVLKSGEKQT
jgi:MFS transporter, ACS family, glucarate transporter